MKTITHLLLLTVLLSGAGRAAEHPNIVVFLSDDHTFRDCSVYGSTDIQTPNMQRLAKAGMTFDQAFVNSPSCAPSRAALLTGFYPAKNGAEANHSKPAADLKKLPAYLQALGYEVASFGKVAHYAQVRDYGFDVARHFKYHEDIAVDRSIEWLRQRKADQPLCLFVGTNWPHVPWPEEIGDIDPAKLRIPDNHVDTPVARQWRARYTAAVQQMDRELGSVYDAARDVLGEDVFFLHTSDHGAQWPFAKWNLYEDGIRTPMIVSWPGHIKADVRSQAIVSWMDILPTLVDVAGESPPESLDGKSFLDVLTGKSDRHHAQMFTTHSGDGDFNVFPARAVRTSDGWKYIRNLHPENRFTSHTTFQRDDGSYWDAWVDEASVDPSAHQTVHRFQNRPAEELYNVNEDPYEQSNLAEAPSHAGQLAQLRSKLDAWMVNTGDPQTVFGNPRKKPSAGSPNIVTVFIDDMGFTDLSCFGGTDTVTENIDRLADEGIRFTNFYVNSPICSPSRTALTTGQYPQRWRITSFLNNRKANNQRGVAQWLDPKAPVLARQLQRAGYFTGHFGKWHMGGQRDVGNAPLITKYGFDRSLTNFEGLGPRVLGYKDSFDGKEAKLHHLGSDKLGKGPIEFADRSVITSKFVDRALKHIDQAIAKEQPFFINVWPDDVHSPFFPPEVLRDKTDESKRQLYYAVLDAMDQQLARLFDRIRNDDALRDNTLVLLCSDNGHEPGAGQSDPLRGGKTLLFEGGIRSPLIVWGPGFIDKSATGTTNASSVFSAIDINRSLYAFAGVDVAEGVTLDGENVLSTMLGVSETGRTTPIFFRRPPDRPGSWGMQGKHVYSNAKGEDDAPDLAVRDGKWKFLIDYDKTDPQLFDLNVDAAESTNLVDRHPEVAQRLESAIFRWNADLPKDAGDPTYQKR